MWFLMFHEKVFRYHHLGINLLGITVLNQNIFRILQITALIRAL